tara:strand:- start:294 stop:2330 length:2037 start_codon:yes stop_codon:yes gene_type:complete
MAQNLKINILAQDKTKQALNSVKGGLARVKSAVFSLQTAFVGLGAGLVIKNLVGTGRELENLRVRLKFLLKNTNEGAKAFDNMVKFASKVPFSLEEIQSGSGILATVTDNADDLQKMLEITGNVAATTGLDFRTAAEQIQRSFSAGIGAADLFREKGVRNMLGFKAGATVSIEDTVAAFERVFGRGGRFGNSTDELAKTFEGTLSMIGDKIFNFKKVLLEAGFFEELKKQFGDLDKFLADNAEELDKIATTVGKNLAQGLAGAVEIGRSLIPTLKKIGEGLVSIKDGFMSLPEFVREAGIIAAFLFGKKGIAAVAGISFLIDKVNDFVKNTKIETGLFDLNNMEDVKLRLEAVNELLKKQKQMQAETQILSGGKVEIAKGELILKDELFDGLRKERDELLKILMNQKEITQEKKFQITEVKNIHEAHISTLKVEKEKTKEIKKQKQEIKNIHEAHLRHKKNVEAENSLRIEIHERIKQQNEEFSLANEMANGILNATQSFSRVLAESLILGKDLVKNFKELAQRILVDILATTINIIISRKIEDILLDKGIIKERTRLNLMQQQESSLQRQIALQAIASVGSFFGIPFKNKGGSVRKGQPVVVGDSASGKGGELFVPNSSGQIIPNSRLDSMGGGVNVNFNISTVDASGFEELLVRSRGTITQLINNAVNEKGRSSII